VRPGTRLVGIPLLLRVKKHSSFAKPSISRPAKMYKVMMVALVQHFLHLKGMDVPQPGAHTPHRLEV
jgi:hypothetical protein